MARTIVRIKAALLILTSSVVDAQTRQDTRTMACNQVRELVYSSGSIVITTGDQKFQRFVESQRFCQPVDEVSVPAFAETQDNPDCWVGYLCRNREDLEAGR